MAIRMRTNRRCSFPLANPCRQFGLSLIELLVALALAMTVLGGAVQVLLTAKQHFLLEHALAELQQNGRFALHYLGAEIRMAGYSGCPARRTPFANAVRGAGGSWYLAGPGLQGYEHNAGLAAFPDAFSAAVLPNTDALVVRYGEVAGLQVVGHDDPTTARIPLNRVHTFQPGQVLLVAAANCSQVAQFQLSSVQGGRHVLEHAVGQVGPGNCTQQLGGTFTCSGMEASSMATYPNGSVVLRLRSEAYYIGASAADAAVPALFRERLLLNSTTGRLYTAAEELVSGVENLQLRYGLDTHSNDGYVDRYLSADAIGSQWARVRTVRISLRLRSHDPVHHEAVAFSAFEDVPGTAGADRYLRRSITTTVAVRNH